MYVHNWSIEDICKYVIAHVAKDPRNKVIIFGVDFTADAQAMAKKRKCNKNYQKGLEEFEANVRAARRERMGLRYDE